MKHIILILMLVSITVNAADRGNKKKVCRPLHQSKAKKPTIKRFVCPDRHTCEMNEHENGSVLFIEKKK